MALSWCSMGCTSQSGCRGWPSKRLFLCIIALKTVTVVCDRFNHLKNQFSVQCSTIRYASKIVIGCRHYIESTNANLSQLRSTEGGLIDAVEIRICEVSIMWRN